MRTFNKKGDQGETSLLYGGRVPKSSPRPEAYGAVDEAMSALGLARALCNSARVKEIVHSVQQDLSILAAELATELDHHEHRYSPVGRLAPAGRYSRPERGSSPPGANGVPPLGGLKEHNWVITAEMVDRLQQWIEQLESEIQMPKAFIVPGATVGSGALDLARSVIRRAERRTVALYRRRMLKNENLLSYLNRAADLVFALARYEETPR